MFFLSNLKSYKIYKLLVLGMITIVIAISLPIDRVVAGYSSCRTVNPEFSDFKLNHCLRQGDSGAMISSLVENLREADYWHGTSTNNFTIEVERAVREFQRDYETIPGLSGRLVIDGVAGPATQFRLCSAIGKGCKPGDGWGCYTGSPRLVVSCLESYGGHAYSDIYPPQP